TDETAKDSEKEKKLSAAAIKKLERQEAIDAHRAVFDRPSRQSAKPSRLIDNSVPPTSAGSPDPSIKYTTSPKTSVLGPKRIACDACRRRRIRCKHKDDVAPTAPGTDTAMNASSPVNDSVQPVPIPSLSMTDQDLATKTFGVRGNSLDAVVIPMVRKVSESKPAPSALVAMQGLNSMPMVVAPLVNRTSSGDGQLDGIDGKRGRNKACAECRKSKRRCIHDENGNVDPVKAQEASIPRGSNSNKKRKSSGENSGGAISKKIKKQASVVDLYRIQDEILVNSPTKPGPSGHQLGPAFQPNMLMGSDRVNSAPAEDGYLEMISDEMVNTLPAQTQTDMDMDLDLDGRIHDAPMMDGVTVSGQDAIDPALSAFDFRDNAADNSQPRHEYLSSGDTFSSVDGAIDEDNVIQSTESMLDPALADAVAPNGMPHDDQQQHHNAPAPNGALPRHHSFDAVPSTNDAAEPQQHEPNGIRPSSPLSPVPSDAAAAAAVDPSPQKLTNGLPTFTPAPVLNGGGRKGSSMSTSPISPFGTSFASAATKRKPTNTATGRTTAGATSSGTVAAGVRGKSSNSASRSGSKVSVVKEERAGSAGNETEDEDARLARALMVEMQGLRRRS
ncbi:hypothetical protein LTS18_004602, partial [Coniosporium uncinatum]